jgi:hypothetical protein
MAVIGSTALTLAAVAQEETLRAPVLEQDDLEPGVAQAAVPQVGSNRLDQQFSFNGISLAFDPSTILDAPLQAGDNQDTVLRGSVTAVRGVEAEQTLDLSPEGARFNTRQSAWIFQLDTMDSRRILTQGIDERGDLLGFRLDFSATGRCFLPGSPVDGYCTYTPGLETNPSLVDPDTLTPSAFLISSEFGQEIPEAVHRSLFAPGFQRGEDVPGAELVGISLDVLNAGFVSDLDPSTLTAFRHEETHLRFVPTAARVEQTLSTNSREAAATRTTRAFVLPEGDELDGAYLAMQLAAWVLPSANDTVGYAPGAPNTSVSNNLFFALNNARVPSDSYTIFQTGRAYVEHSATSPRSAAETPVARYNGFWMGMSPVREVRSTQRLQFIPTGDRVSVDTPAFDQGGGGTPFGDLVDAGITLIDDFDQSITNVNIQNVDDLYVQLGLDLTLQDTIRRVTTTETTNYRLVPHLSFNGNRTGGETVFRYYTGVIFSDETNAYVGADFTLAAESGWNAYARLDLYSAPDLDYRSEIELRGSRTFDINPSRRIVVGAGGVLELDNVLDNGRGTSDDEAQADVFARWQEGSFDFSLNERFTRDGSGSWDQSTTIGLGYSQDDLLSVSAQFTPWSTESSYVEAAVGVNFRLEGVANSPVLQAQLARTRYEIGGSSFGASATVTENVFRAGLQMRF